MRSRHRQATQRSERVQRLHKFFTRKYADTFVGANSVRPFDLHDEIIKAVKNIIDDVQEGKINKENINQELFSDYLYTKDSPDPDLIIRPSGEQRISNFLLWQCAYSEFWYSNVNWPDFSEKDLQRAIYDYQNRDRRFGGV